MTLEDIREALERGVKFSQEQKYQPGHRETLDDIDAVVLAILNRGGFDFELEDDLPHVTMSMKLDKGDVVASTGLLAATIPKGSRVSIRGLSLQLVDASRDPEPPGDGTPPPMPLT